MGIDISVHLEVSGDAEARQPFWHAEDDWALYDWFADLYEQRFGKEYELENWSERRPLYLSKDDLSELRRAVEADELRDEENQSLREHRETKADHLELVATALEHLANGNKVVVWMLV